MGNFMYFFLTQQASSTPLHAIIYSPAALFSITAIFILCNHPSDVGYLV